MSRIHFVYTAATLLALAAQAHAQPLVVTIQPQSDDPVAGLWRLEGSDDRGERTVEQMRFEALPGGRYRYERGERLDGFGRTEKGEAEFHGGQIFARETPLEDMNGLMIGLGGGLENALKPVRHAVYSLDRRITGEAPAEAKGWFYYPSSTQRGSERLSRFERAAANNDVLLLVDGNEYFPELRNALEGAQRSIELQTFIYTDDSTGQWVANLLMEKARQGISVRVLTDGVDSSLSAALKADLRDAGVELKVAHRWGESIVGSIKNVGHSLWGGIRSLFGKKPKPREKRGLFDHDHRKIIVVDSRVAFIGGMNIAEEYEHEWHDVGSRVEGDAVLEMQELFYDRWWAAGQVGEIPLHDPQIDTLTYAPGNLSVDVLVTLPGLKTEIKQRYLQEIEASTDRVWIECAYFLDDEVIGALKRKTWQGLDTLVIVPNDPKHDVKIVRDAFNWVQNDVVRSGIRLYKYRGPMVHSKVATFDGLVATLGSSNLDNLALTQLAEANIFVNDRGFTQLMDRRVFEVDVPASDRVTIEKMSWWKRVKGGVLHFIRSFL